MAGGRNGRHPQVVVRYEDHDIEVDAGIAPLLEELWRLGFKTFGSCENFVRGAARIWFITADDRAAFSGYVEGYRAFLDGTWPCVQFNSSEIASLTERFRPLTAVPTSE